MTLYRVVGWNEHFENNRTRELKRMDWVPVPNKHDGDGFTELLSHPNGMAHYGAWHLILQVASKCTPRGTLVRDVTIPQDGAGECRVPHDSFSLSRITHGDQKVFLEAISRLLTIGWLEICEESRQYPAPACGKVPEALTGTEGKGTEGKGKREDAAPAIFAEIPSWEEWWTYCQQLSLIAEWFAKDKYLAAAQDNWKGKSNWKGYAMRCRVWWEEEGRPLARPDRPGTKPKGIRYRA